MEDVFVYLFELGYYLILAVIHYSGMDVSWLLST